MGIEGFEMTSVKFKLQKYWSSWDFILNGVTLKTSKCMNISRAWWNWIDVSNVSFYFPSVPGRGGRNRIGRREKWPKKSWEEGEIGGKSREEGEIGSESREKGDLPPVSPPPPLGKECESIISRANGEQVGKIKTILLWSIANSAFSLIWNVLQKFFEKWLPPCSPKISSHLWY